jgi:hypothetical protein
LDRSNPADHLFRHPFGQLGLERFGWFRYLSRHDADTNQAPAFTLLFRQKTMAFTDKRAKLLQELLSGIKIIKFFAWEGPYLDKIRQVRDPEIRQVFIDSGAE